MACGASRELYAQEGEVTSIKVLSLLLPRGIARGLILREEIAEGNFAMPGSMTDDWQLLDDVYLESMRLSHGNVQSALLCSAYGVFEHHYIPLAGIGKIPLTLESDARFQQRYARLPKHLYSNKINDSDKAQHFFSSAWLKSTLGMTWLVQFAGSMVEFGESLFVSGGTDDPRDRHANANGVTFAIDAEQGVLPSEDLTPNP